MNKKLYTILFTTLIALSGCGNDLKKESADTKSIKKTEKIVIGATPVPHAEILEFIKPKLEKDGYTLEIKIFNDYVIPNKATDSGEIDANFFQHTPYLEKFNAEQNTKLTNIANIHIEPMGIYSKKIKSLDELKSGDSVAIPNDPTNGGRALDVLESAGLIKLNDEKFKTKLSVIENPKNIKITELEAAQLPRVIDDFTIAIINTNYALPAGLNPNKDALLLEAKDSPYANILVVKVGNENLEKIVALKNALQSEDVRNFINEKYQGAIIPAF